MIAYDLKCKSRGHAFEGWFASRGDYDDQLQSGLLACPLCGCADIERALSAPNVGMKSNQRSAAAARPSPVPATDTSAGTGQSTTAMSGAPAIPPQMRDALAKIAEAQGKMLEKSEWVGGKFVDEVRAQHYGETDERMVHGEASAKDAADLAEEGIAIMPVLFPVAPPDRRN